MNPQTAQSAAIEAQEGGTRRGLVTSAVAAPLCDTTQSSESLGQSTPESLDQSPRLLTDQPNSASLGQAQPVSAYTRPICSGAAIISVCMALGLIGSWFGYPPTSDWLGFWSNVSKPTKTLSLYNDVGEGSMKYMAPIEFDESETLEELKAKIQAATGYKPEHYRLNWNGKELSDNDLKNLSEDDNIYLREVEEDLESQVRNKVDGPKLYVKVFTKSGNESNKMEVYAIAFTDDGEVSDTIKDVKDKIQAATGYKPEQYRLNWNGKELSDNDLTNLSEGDNLVLKVRKYYGIHTMYYTLHNMGFGVSFDEFETLEELKAKIVGTKLKEDLQRNPQQYVFIDTLDSGKQLPDQNVITSLQYFTQESRVPSFDGTIDPGLLLTRSKSPE